jgi:hypothetical protein
VSDGPHWVKIRQLWLTGADGVRYPYKWKGECLCGWVCISWEWSRDWYYECRPDQLAITLDECGPDALVTGGALSMALDHVGLYIPSKT